MQEEFYNVFVYGSLKRGFGNHSYLDGQEFLGDAKSVDDNFVMVSLGAFPAVLKDIPSDNLAISGEIYKVNEETLYYLDMLEGNGSLYKREKRQFILDNGKKMEAWIYLMSPRTVLSLGRKLRKADVKNDSYVW